MSTSEIKDAILTKAYWHRWYIIFIFGTLGLIQNIIWLTWSPISISARCAYGFDNGEIELLENWMMIVYLFASPLVIWMLNNKLLRLTMLISTFLSAVGCGLQCLPVPVNVFKYFAHLGQIFNSFGHCVVIVGPTLYSNAWFPTSQRVTATSIATGFPALGSAAGFVLGPNIVQEPSHNAINGSSCNISHSEEMEIKHDIMKLIYIEFTLAAIVFICTLVYFPNHPPLPPSVTASMDRLDLKNAALQLSKNGTFMMYNLALALSGGKAFQAIYNLILAPFGISQRTTGAIVLVSMLGGGAIGIIMGWLADRWKGHLRVMLIVLFGISFISSLYFMFITSDWFHVKWLQFSEAGAWASLVTLGLVLSGLSPLGNELIAESGFPASEAASLGISHWCNTLFSFIQLLVSGVLEDVSYATYILVVALLTATIILLLGKEPNTRLKIDTNPLNDTDQMTDHSPLLPKLP